MTYHHAVSGYGVIGIPARFCAVVALWLRRARTRRHLRELERHRLDDIGLCEADRLREAAKWFWQP